jgi:hypothetical protein
MNEADFVGGRITRYKFGLVADLKPESPYTAPFYFLIEIQKGIRITHEHFPVDDPSFSVSLNFLGKIIAKKTQTENRVAYFFIDGTSLTINMVESDRT